MGVKTVLRINCSNKKLMWYPLSHQFLMSGILNMKCPLFKFVFWLVNLQRVDLVVQSYALESEDCRFELPLQLLGRVECKLRWLGATNPIINDLDSYDDKIAHRINDKFRFWSQNWIPIKARFNLNVVFDQCLIKMTHFWSFLLTLTYF